MRFAVALVLLCSLLGLLFWATDAHAAGGVTVDPSVRQGSPDSPWGGSPAHPLSAGRKYLRRVTDADDFTCFASTGSTCAAAGEKFPAGMAMIIFISSDLKSVSCRSTGSNGDLIFTKVD